MGLFRKFSEAEWKAYEEGRRLKEEELMKARVEDAKRQGMKDAEPLVTKLGSVAMSVLKNAKKVAEKAADMGANMEDTAAFDLGMTPEYEDKKRKEAK